MIKINVDELAASIVSAFPTLDVFEQRLSLVLYRLLASGDPAPRDLLAERLQAPIDTVNRILDAWPGVFSDSRQRIIGYWGLSVAAAYASPHRLTIDGRTLSAWCAWGHPLSPSIAR